MCPFKQIIWTGLIRVFRKIFNSPFLGAFSFELLGGVFSIF